MYRFVFLVLALSANQVFGQNCADFKTCMKNITQANEEVEKYVNDYIDQVDSKLANITSQIFGFSVSFRNETENGSDDCKYLGISVMRTILYSCGVQSVERGTKVEKLEEILSQFPEDIANSKSLRKKSVYCRNFVELANIRCNRTIEGVEAILNCDTNSQATMLRNNWLRCTGNFN